MSKTVKTLLFGLLVLALLVGGCIGAQALWDATHHRYANPNTGYYNSSVHALFWGNEDEVYSFHFRGQSERRWRWVYSTNFVYRNLHFEWSRFDSQAQVSEDSGTLKLPSLAYESPHGTGVLTRGKLAEWLLGATNGTPGGSRSVDALFSFLEAAGRGSLPCPRHHTHYIEQPVRGSIQHFLHGFGVGGFVYMWIGIWLVSVVFVGWKLWRKRGGA